LDKRIRFETKEEANARCERAFMTLTPHERLQGFLRSFDGRLPEDDSAAERQLRDLEEDECCSVMR
jgi:hypothetical protein